MLNAFHVSLTYIAFTSLNRPIIRDSVEAVITVNEDEIIAATRLVYVLFVCFFPFFLHHMPTHAASAYTHAHARPPENNGALAVATLKV